MLQDRFGFQDAKDNRIEIDISIPHLPISATSYWVPVGACRDPQGKNGLSHMFEHLLGTNTKLFRNRQSRLDEIEKNGFFYNATTTKVLQRYFLLHDSDQYEKARLILDDTIFSTNFLTNDIESERNVILSEESTNFSDITSYIWRLADKGIWNNSPLSNDIFGTEYTLKSISEQDINQFYQKQFLTNNILQLSINSRNLGKIKDTVQQEQLIKYKNETIPVGNINSFVFENRETESLHLAFTFLTTNINNLNDRLTLDFIRAYLANGWISKLIQKLRVEKHLTYWVNGATNYYSNSGILRFILVIAPKDYEKVLNIFEKEIVELKNTLLPKSVIHDHLSKYISDINRSSMDLDWLLWWYGWDGLLSSNGVLLLSSYISKLQKITPEDIQLVANKYFNSSSFSIAEIGYEPIDIGQPSFR